VVPAEAAACITVHSLGRSCVSGTRARQNVVLLSTLLLRFATVFQGRRREKQRENPSSSKDSRVSELICCCWVEDLSSTKERGALELM